MPWCRPNPIAASVKIVHSGLQEGPLGPYEVPFCAFFLTRRPMSYTTFGDATSFDRVASPRSKFRPFASAAAKIGCGVLGVAALIAVTMATRALLASFAGPHIEVKQREQAALARSPDRQAALPAVFASAPLEGGETAANRIAAAEPPVDAEPEAVPPGVEIPLPPVIFGPALVTPPLAFVVGPAPAPYAFAPGVEPPHLGPGALEGTAVGRWCARRVTPRCGCHAWQRAAAAPASFRPPGSRGPGADRDLSASSRPAAGANRSLLAFASPAAASAGGASRFAPLPGKPRSGSSSRSWHSAKIERRQRRVLPNRITGTFFSGSLAR